MYKDGINLNTVTVEKLKTLPGIGDNLARSLILHRELKSEFVNPVEFKDIIPQNVYAGITVDYSIYTVSPSVWKSRITSQKIQLYNSDLRIFSLSEESFAICPGKDVYLLNLSPGGGDGRVVERLLNERGLLTSLKRFFGWKAHVKALILPEVTDMGELDSFLSFYDIEKVRGPRIGDIIDSSDRVRVNIASSVQQGKMKKFLAPDSLIDKDLEISIVYPTRQTNARASAFLVSYGSVKMLLMFNMMVDDQHSLIQKNTTSAIRRVNIVYSCGFEPLPALVKFCGNPRVMNFRNEKELVCDGNLIYVKKQKK